MGRSTDRIRNFLCPTKKTPVLRTLTPIIPLKKYLDKAYKKVKTDPGDKLGPDLGLRTCVPISIFLRGTPGHSHEYAGVSDEIDGTLHRLDEEECFSGSLIKVAAMFAAYKLRAEAKSLIKEVESGAVAIAGGTEPLKVRDFFKKLKEKLNLGSALPEISRDAPTKEPIFGEILEITGSLTALSTLDVQFTTNFNHHLREMIIPSNNCSAGECIFRLSYPYINVKLMDAGFLDRATRKGIWLCGDYIVTSPPAPRADACFNQDKSRPFIRIDTINDCNQTITPPFCGSAQNTTSKQMASFFLKILQKELVDPDSSLDMLGLLQEAQLGPDSSFLDIDLDSKRNTGAVVKQFTIDAVKIGQGPIKPDPVRGLGLEVRSEGMLIKWDGITPGTSGFDPALKKHVDDRNLTGEAAICWQNLSGRINTDGITEILNTAISNFIKQVPLTP